MNYHAVYYRENKAALNAAARRRVREINESVFKLFGNHCITCGETEFEFLTIDHIFCDRASERSASSLTWKRDLLAGRKDLARYQLLCRNCNEAKQRLDPSNLLKERIPTGQTKRCATCLLDKDTSEFSTSSYRNVRCLDSQCYICARFVLTVLTIRCYEFLGNACRCCRIDSPCALNIDHILNDGAEKRRRGEPTGVNLCRQILNQKVDSALYQLLCANCNYSKLVAGSCVHSRRLAA